MPSETILCSAIWERKGFLLTDSIFFDTDCICAFLWVHGECLLEKIVEGKIIIPKPVYDEIDRPSIPHLKRRIDELLAKGSAEIMYLSVDSEEYVLYRELTTFSGDNKVIGRGEAASISLAKKHDGIVGSNNLKDVAYYVKKYALKHMTTGDLLVEAYESGLITESEGNAIWQAMLNKRRQIGARSFTEYLEKG